MTEHKLARKKRIVNTDIQSKYYVTAEETFSGAFVGVFAIPGKDKQTARNDDGSIAVFDEEEAAIAAAGEDLCEVMNARTRSHFHNNGYRVMGGADLAVQLKKIGISPATFAVFCGTTQDRVMQWIDGSVPIPRTVNLIAELLSVPGAIDAAQDLTDRIMFKKDREYAAR